MDYKINCRLVNILLDENNEFANKYCSVLVGNYDCNTLLEDYFVNKNMRTIKIDHNNQSICFTNQTELLSFYNQNNKKTELYHEEVHIHCNNLLHFDHLVNYLYQSKYSTYVDEVTNLPHYDKVNTNNFHEYELMMEPMTNEVATTKSLINLLSKNTDETIFRAIAIYFGKLVNNNSEINSELIHKLNSIYENNVTNANYGFFSDTIGNQLLNIDMDDYSHESKMVGIPSERLNIDHNIYDGTPNNEEDTITI